MYVCMYENTNSCVRAWIYIYIYIYINKPPGGSAKWNEIGGSLTQNENEIPLSGEFD